jgi:hypothetical protein
MGRQHGASLVVVGALHVERVRAFKAKYDSILIVDSYRVEPSQISAEGVQSVPGPHLQIVKPRHRVYLIELATDGRPELTWDPSSRFAVEAVPDIQGRFIGERPDHRIAL